MKNIIKKTILAMLVLSFPSISSIAYAGCSCECVNGQEQPICASKFDLRPLNCSGPCSRHAPRDTIKPYSPLVKPHQKNRPSDWHKNPYKSTKPNKQKILIKPKKNFRPLGTSKCDYEDVYNKESRRNKPQVLCY